MLTESKSERTFQRAAASVNIETATKFITLNAYVTFFLFLIGAVSSCVGGYIGYSKKLKTATDVV